MNHLERGGDGRNQFWRYLVMTLAAVIGGQIIGGIPLAAILITKGLSLQSDMTIPGLSNNATLVLMLLPFVASLLIMILLIKPLHQRRLMEVINGTLRMRWGRFFYAAMLWMLIQGICLAISIGLNPDLYEFHFNAAAFVPLLLIALALIPLQTSFEEVYFRGYLAQGIGAATRNRWAAIIIPGVAFGLMHLMNPEVKAYGIWIMLPQYVLVGFLFGLVATLDDGIECAMGLHAANNFFACTIVTFNSSALRTDALLNVKVVNPAMDLVWVVITAVVIVLLLHRKYRWDFSVLNRRIGLPPIPEPRNSMEIFPE